MAYGILHDSTPESHSGRCIRLRGSKRQILYVVVSDKYAKSYTRSSEAPSKREPDYKQTSAEIIPSTYAGFVTSCATQDHIDKPREPIQNKRYCLVYLYRRVGYED